MADKGRGSQLEFLAAVLCTGVANPYILKIATVPVARLYISCGGDLLVAAAQLATAMVSPRIRRPVSEQ